MGKTLFSYPRLFLGIRLCSPLQDLLSVFDVVVFVIVLALLKPLWVLEFF